MSLLDFDDTYVPPFTPSRSTIRRATEERGGADNFNALQEIETKKKRSTFEDMPTGEEINL